MNEPRAALSKLATDALAAERTSVPPPSAVQRARAIALVSETIVAEARTRRRRRWTIGLASSLAVAAACVLFVSLSWFRGHGRGTDGSTPANPTVVRCTAHALAGEVALVHDGRRTALDLGAPIVQGDRVVAAEGGRAAIALSTGTHVIVGAGSDVAIAETGATQSFTLHAGSIHADVAKLVTGERFLVHTDDVEIEVRGTSFTVSLVTADPSCGGGTPTRLVVDEGVVVVRAAGVEDRVAAGEEWPRGCGPSTVQSPATDPTVGPTPPLVAANGTKQGAPSIAAVTSPPLASPPLPTGSDLAAQNDLFAQATAEKQRGDTAKAIAAYERFLAKYPGSTLAESAIVERMRLLRAIDPGRGALAAKSYLARYPKGFARGEAEGIAAGAP